MCDSKVLFAKKKVEYYDWSNSTHACYCPLAPSVLPEYMPDTFDRHRHETCQKIIVEIKLLYIEQKRSMK